MAVFNTTDYIDTSIHLKSRLTKNFSDDNYWIESYQNKINYAWDFASDVVDIEESIEQYTDNSLKADLQYQMIEVRINSVYDEKGMKLSDDFKKIIFKNIKHPLRLSQKYKFNIKNFINSTEDDKSIWLNMNYDETNKGASAILRRCNSTIGFLVNNYTSEWYEPAILENEFTYTNIDFNTAVKVPQDEVYITVQYNEYTKNISISDRFIIGALDFNNIVNNNVYKVKAIHKMGTDSTFETNNIPFLKLALDRDSINPKDDYVCLDTNHIPHYIANFYTKKQQDGIVSQQNYALRVNPTVDIIYEGETVEFTCGLYDQNNNEIQDNLQIQCELPLTQNDTNYYQVHYYENNRFAITNLHQYYKSDLIVTILPSEQYCDIIKPLKYSIQLGEKL